MPIPVVAGDVRRPAIREVMAMEWEYRILNWDRDPNFTSGMSDQQMEGYMTEEFGEHGWELVSAVKDGDVIWLFMKRPKG